MIIKEFQINEEIRDAEVRLIDENGTAIGIVPIQTAQELAEKRNLDLVKISPNAKPPVCKILDYGKFKYEQIKKEKESKKNQQVANLKEIRMSLRVEEHDLNIKARNARKFLEEGDKVKVSVRFRGREIAYAHKGVELLNRFTEKVSDAGSVEKEAKAEGRNAIMFLKPHTDKSKKSKKKAVEKEEIES
ncbi:MAG: translation initiation factor IF-3 [Eubacteriaceae bacterium]|nr:translation initiation factor IF-3 [Eubacteriaceae bacterium]